MQYKKKDQSKVQHESEEEELSQRTLNCSIADSEWDAPFSEVPNYSVELNVCLSVCPSDEKHFFLWFLHKLT